MKRAIVLLPLLSHLHAAPITLTVDPDNSTITTYTTLNGQAVTENTATGTIELDLTLAPITHKPTNITFTGGTIFYSDSNSTYTPDALPPVENLIINSSNTSGSLATINPNSPIDAITGALTNEDHTTSLLDGTLFIDFQAIISGIPFSVFSTTTDFSTEPSVNPFFGENTLTSTLLASTPLIDSYRISLTTTTDTTPIDLSDQGVNLIIAAEGGFTANATFTKPSSAFLTWSASHQPTAHPPEILYALGLPPEENKLPLSITPGEITVTLPETGSLIPITIQHSTDLASWSTLQTIPANSSGVSTFLITDLPSGFVRLALE